MSPPEKPPSTADVFGKLARADAAAFGRVLAMVGAPSLSGPYLHWDELRRRPPPAGLTLELWWTAIRMTRRAATTRLSLRNTEERAFCFVRTDHLARVLHRVDRALGDPQLIDDGAGLAKANRDRYLVRSIAEEAISSSLIEGAATTRVVAEKMLREGRKPRTHGERMIVNNHRAMELIRSRRTEALSPEFLLEIQSVLTQDTLDPSEVGRFRRTDKNIQVVDHGSGEVVHVPPPAQELTERIAALCAFANATDDATGFVHPVVRAITLHFMVGFDHPFVDGNGRTARALFYWSLLRNGYWMAEFLSISSIIYKARAKYGRAFLHTETDDGDLTYFLLNQLEVIEQAIVSLKAWIRRKAEELQDVDALLKSDAGLNHRQRAVLAHALRHPNATYVIEGHQREHNVVYQTARTDLLGLVSKGLLQSQKEGRTFVFSPRPDLERRLRRAL